MEPATRHRKSSTSIHDYPEHLNPFYEDDNHNKIRFWTIGRKPGRSNSFSLNNIKDFRNTWSLKSFMKKNKRGQDAQKDNKPQSPANGEASPIVYRRAVQYGFPSESSPSPNSEHRYVYGGSVTPLPRSRFQERMRSTPPPSDGSSFRHQAPERASFSHRAAEPYALPGLTRRDVNCSRLSVESNNPFEEAGPVPAVRRKKKRAAPLPPGQNGVSPTTSKDKDSIMGEKVDKDLETDDPSLMIELKIVEEVGDTPTKVEGPRKPDRAIIVAGQVEIQEVTKPETPLKCSEISQNPNKDNPSEPVDSLNNEDLSVEVRNKKPEADDSDNNDVVFEKINIRQYRRNSSVNADIINLRNGNPEVSPLTNKRCKSLSNTINTNNNFTTYDIALHINEDNNNDVKDVNDNPAPPQKVVCKLLDNGKPRKASVDNSISSTDREFNELDRATRALEIEINKLNLSARAVNNTSMDDNYRRSDRKSVSDIKSRFENPAMYSPNPIPKPRRSTAGSTSPVSPR